MTPRECVDCAMRGGRTGRLAVAPLIDTSYAAARCGMPVSACFLDPRRHAAVLEGTLAAHPGIDGLSVNIGLTPAQIETCSETTDGFQLLARDGVEWFIPANDTGTPVKRHVTRLDDDCLRSSDSFRPHIVETLKAVSAGVRERLEISAGVTGPFSQVAFVIGIDRLMTAMLEEPAALHNAIAGRLEFTFEWVEEMARLNAGSVWIGEGFASNSLISPRQYEEFVLPYQRLVCKRLRELGARSVIHICGKASKMLESIAGAGADCFEADWQVDLADAKARIGRRMCLKGNLHTTKLLEGTPEQVRGDAREAIRKAASGGRFILSSGCAVARDTPPCNIEAMVEEARQYGSC